MNTAPHGTIFALSSGAPPAAIAVIRISGPEAGAALRTLAGRLPAPRYASLVHLRDHAGATLDHALALWFPGPRSATGEDLAELHLHGGRAVIAAVLDALTALPGLVPALPGAFTRRALVNGRIGLTEAEGLADLLAAEAEGQRRQALRLVEGGLGRLVDDWRRELLRIAAMVEAIIDHEEELDTPDPQSRIMEDVADLRRRLQSALDQPPAERMRDGIRVLVAGPVNAGKSSLVNALVGRDVAITTSIEGTTRDLIEVPVVFDGIPMILIDSAGLRTSTDPVERIGIERARSAMEAADLILWLGTDEDRPAGQKVIGVSNKADRPDTVITGIAVSATTGLGIRDLTKELARRGRLLVPPESAVALNNRHRQLLGEVVDELASAETNSDYLLLAEQLRSARQTFDMIQGSSGVEEMLDELFARFCVGK